jgi:hypothetical protein
MNQLQGLDDCTRDRAEEKQISFLVEDPPLYQVAAFHMQMSTISQMETAGRILDIVRDAFSRCFSDFQNQLFSIEQIDCCSHMAMFFDQVPGGKHL